MLSSWQDAGQAPAPLPPLPHPHWPGSGQHGGFLGRAPEIHAGIKIHARKVARKHAKDQPNAEEHYREYNRQFAGEYIGSHAKEITARNFTFED